MEFVVKHLSVGGKYGCCGNSGVYLHPQVCHHAGQKAAVEKHIHVLCCAWQCGCVRCCVRCCVKELGRSRHAQAPPERYLLHSHVTREADSWFLPYKENGVYVYKHGIEPSV